MFPPFEQDGGRLALAAEPEHTGEALMEFAVELHQAGRGDRARRLLEAGRDHLPTPEERQYASVELAKLLREGRDPADTAEAERITSELLRPGNLGEGPAQLLGEDLQELERWEEALRCHNIAARRLLAEPPEELEDEDDLSLAPLVSRLLARMRLGLERDAHDDVALVVAYRNPQGGRVHLVDCHDALCSDFTDTAVTGPGWARPVPGLAVDSRDRAHMLTPDFTEERLVLLSCLDRSCSQTSSEPLLELTSQEEPALTALALDDRDRPHMLWGQGELDPRFTGGYDVESEAL